MIELMVVVALVAIVLSLAAPSFKTFLMKKRVEGAMSELSTDLQFARSEAVSRVNSSERSRRRLGTLKHISNWRTVTFGSGSPRTPSGSSRPLWPLNPGTRELTNCLPRS